MSMKHNGCENEARVLDALAQGMAPEAMEESLRRHLAGCASCAEVVSIFELFQADSERLCAAAPLPKAGHVWWRATLAARRAATERALRPILIAERTALAIGGGALLALLFFVAPWLTAKLKHLSLFTGTLVYSFSLSSLFVTSFALFLLLML